MSRNFKIRLFVRGGKNARQVRFRLKLDQRHEKHSRVSHSVLKYRYLCKENTLEIQLFYSSKKVCPLKCARAKMGNRFYFFVFRNLQNTIQPFEKFTKWKENNRDTFLEPPTSDLDGNVLLFKMWSVVVGSTTQFPFSSTQGISLSCG